MKIILYVFPFDPYSILTTSIFRYTIDPEDSEKKEDMDKIMAAFKKIQLWEFCVENTGMITCLIEILFV